MQVPSWFFYFNGFVLIAVGIAQMVLRRSDRREAGRRGVAGVRALWPAFLIAAGVAVVLYAAGVLPQIGPR